MHPTDWEDLFVRNGFALGGLTYGIEDLVSVIASKIFK